MARRMTDDEQDLRRKARRRLIGAIALTLVVVIVLPMILDSEPKSNGRDIELSIPDPDKSGEFKPGKFSSNKTTGNNPAASPVEVSPLTAEKNSADSTNKAGERESIKNVAKPEVSSGKTLTPARQEAAKPASKLASDVTEGFVAQVGAYSSADTAKQELSQLKKWGFKAYIEKSGDTTRVRVGPYAEREKAEKARQQLEKHGLHPVVMSIK